MVRNSPGLDADSHAKVAEMAPEDRRVGVQVEWPLAFVQRRPQTAAGVDLLQRAAGGDQSAHHARRHCDSLVEGGKLLVQHPVGEVEMGCVDGEAAARGPRHRLTEVLLVDAELGRASAAVQTLGVTAHHAAARIEAQPDRAPGAAPPDAVDLREQIHVDVQRERRDDVEVAGRDVGARVADLLG